MTDIAILIPQAQPREQMLPDYAHGASVGIPVYALAETDLSAYACLIIPTSADQRELQRCQVQLQNYLDAGGKLVVNGHVTYRFLEVLQPYCPSTEKGLAGLQVYPLNNHPIFAGVKGQDLTYRKGVAGFYGRGCNPPPVGAQVLTELGTLSRLPLDWLYTYSSGGQLLVHAGNDFLSFNHAPSTQLMRAAFFDWVASPAAPCATATHVVTQPWQVTAPEEVPVPVPSYPLRRVCLVENGSYFHHRTLHTPEFAPYTHMHRHVLDLQAQDFAEADVLVFCCNTRGDLIARHQTAIAEFLTQGKTVVAMGSTSPEHWLPQIAWTDCPVNFWWWTEKDTDSGLHVRWPEHRLFQHLTLADATWHQHGSFQVPEGARSLIDKEGQGSILYEDCTSTPGRIILMTLDPCYHHGSYFMPATTRFLRGFLPWLHQHTAPRTARV